ncbi:hypothetical protein FRC11_008154, partial [Ceratobasidium sp. 423]
MDRNRSAAESGENVGSSLPVQRIASNWTRMAGCCPKNTPRERVDDPLKRQCQLSVIRPPIERARSFGSGFLMLDDLVHNHALYKLEKIIVEDEESRGKLKTQMRIRLTALRNAIKDKMETAVDNSHCMNRVISDIMPKQIAVTAEHRRRWAWILAQYRAYRNKNTDTS